MLKVTEIDDFGVCKLANFGTQALRRGFGKAAVGKESSSLSKEMDSFAKACIDLYGDEEMDEELALVVQLLLNGSHESNFDILEIFANSLK